MWSASGDLADAAAKISWRHAALQRQPTRRARKLASRCPRATRKFGWDCAHVGFWFWRVRRRRGVMDCGKHAVSGGEVSHLAPLAGEGGRGLKLVSFMSGFGSCESVRRHRGCTNARLLLIHARQKAARNRSQRITHHLFVSPRGSRNPCAARCASRPSADRLTPLRVASAATQKILHLVEFPAQWGSTKVAASHVFVVE